MNIDQIRRAKKEAEDKILQILADLQEGTGMTLAGVDIPIVERRNNNRFDLQAHREGNIIGNVRINLLL